MKTTFNSITNQEELAIELQRLSKVVAGRRDSYLIKHKTASLDTLVRHAGMNGLEVSLYCARTNTAIRMTDRGSMYEAMEYLISELRGSFITHHQYMLWVKKLGLRSQTVTMWKNGDASPKLDMFLRIVVEELGYELKLLVAEG